MPSLSHLPAVLLAAALFASLSAPAAHGQDRRKATPVMAPAPPPAMPQSVRVLRDGKVEIPLRIYGRKNETLRYLVKTPPAQGALSEVRVVDPEVSAVTYTPPADLAVTAERFTFAVQNSTGVSAPVEVTIAIIDNVPMLTMPGTLEFGAILAGATESQEFELANRGGGVAEGEVKVGPPWRIEGRDDFRLAAGESTTFKVVFAPTEGGDFRGEIAYSADRGHSTALVGTAVMPVSAVPAFVELRHEPGFALRTGSFELINRTDEPRTFRLSAGPRLRVDGEATVPAGGRVAVAVSAETADVAPLADAVLVEAPGFLLRVPVKAAAVGAIVRFSQPRFSLGNLPAAMGGQLPIAVQNTGGSPATVAGEIGAPFALTPANFTLAPGETRQVTLAIQRAAPGPYRGWLKLTGAPVTAEAEIQAVLVSGNASSRNSPRSTRSHPASEEAAGPEEPMGAPVNLYRQRVRISEVTPTGALIEWPAEINAAQRFRFERRVLSLDAGRKLRVEWLAPKVAYSLEGSHWRARLTELQPQQLHKLRVIPLDAQGASATAPLFSIEFFTPAKRPFLRAPSPTQALLGALVLCLGALAWKRMRRPRAPFPTGL